MEVLKNIMQEFEVKRGHSANLEKKIVQGFVDAFGVEPMESQGRYTIRYGALKRLDVWLGKNGKSLVIDSEADPEAGDDAIVDTNRRFRRYLEQVTGFTAKERVKRAKKGVEG